MSRLDSFIRRLQAQRACLSEAAAQIRGVDGFVLELGLGNGRTFDHLREICADGQNRLTIISGNLRVVLLLPRRVFSFRHFDRAQLLFPELFEMPRDQPILWFNRVILPLGALRFEPRAL